MYTLRWSGVLGRSAVRCGAGSHVRTVSTAAPTACTLSPAATTPGSVFGWGNNTDKQLTYEAVKDQLSPTPISLPGPVRDISCGVTHTVAVLESGHVYTWGTHEHGALGTKDGMEVDAPPLRSTDEPTIVDVLAGQKIVAVAAGHDHSVAVGEDGDVYTWGWGGSFFSGYGGLGHGNKQDQDFPGLVSAIHEDGHKVVQVAAGKKHTLALTDEGLVLAWGDGEFGRIGNGKSSAPEPEVVEELQHLRCKQVAAGESFSAAVTVEGDLYLWGKNDQSQLGLGANLTMDLNSLEEFPLVNPILKKIGPVSSISLGKHHAVAIMDSGDVYHWGSRQFIEPSKLMTLDGIRIVQAACGDDATALLADDGGVYSFGKNRGRFTLGHGGKWGQKHPLRIQYFDENTISIGKLAMGMKAAFAVVGTPVTPAMAVRSATSDDSE